MSGRLALLPLLLTLLITAAEGRAQEAAPKSGQRMRITGSVHDVALVDHEVRLLVDFGKTALTVCWQAPTDSPRPDDLLDALVEVTSSMETKAGQGGRLQLASPNDLRVIKPGSADVFTRPLRSLASLREKPKPQLERIRVIATVSYASVAGWFHIQDATGTARGKVADPLPLPPEQRRASQANPTLHSGDEIELVGAVQADRSETSLPYLMQCEWRILSHGPAPAFEPVTASKIIAGGYDGKAVSIAGDVVELDQ